MPKDKRQLRAELSRSRTLTRQLTQKAADPESEAAAVVDENRPHPRRRAAATTVEVEGRKVLQTDLLFEVGPTKDYRGEDKQTGETLVVRRKTLKDRATRKEAESEVELLRNLYSHPHIVQFHAAKVTKKKTDDDGKEIKPALAMYLFEFCPGGTLRAALLKSGAESFPQEQALEVIGGIAAALAYLERLEIIHYDLGCDCIRQGPNGLWKISEFGRASQTTYELEGAKKKQIAEAKEFLATRCLLHRPPEAQDLSLCWPIGKAVDVFAFGCVLYAVMNGEPPGPEDGWKLGPPPEPGEDYAPALTKWLRRCVAKDPRLRPAARELDREVGVFRATAEEPPDLSTEVLQSAIAEFDTLREQRQYRDLASLLPHLKGLAAHFEPRRAEDDVSTILTACDSSLAALRKQISEDYATVPGPDYDRKKGVEDASSCVDVVDPSLGLRREIVNAFCDVILQPYREIFASDGLDRWTRRYPWLKRTFREMHEKYGRYFPDAWKVPRHLAEIFCHTTRKDVMELLAAENLESNPELLIAAMKESIEFETYLENKFPSTTRKRRRTVKFGNKRPVDASAAAPAPAALDDPASTFQGFRGIISTCFEPSLGIWVEWKEKELFAEVDKAVSGRDAMEELGQAASSGERGQDQPRLVYASAKQLFDSMEDTLVKCDFTKRQPLLQLFQATARVFAHYVEKLEARIPKQNWAQQILQDHAQMLCCIIGSAEYCDIRAPTLASIVRESIIPELANDVTYSPQLKMTRDLIKKGHQALAESVGSYLDGAFAQMKLIRWHQFKDDVTSPSPYVDVLTEKLTSHFERVSKNLSVSDFDYFSDKFARYFIHRFMDEVLMCNKISEQGAAQILLDASFLKTSLLEAPVMCTGSQSKTIYSKFVLREMGRIETMLGVIAGALEDTAASLTELFGEDPSEEAEALIDKILALRSDSESPGAAPPGHTAWKTKLTLLGDRLKEQREKTTTGLGVLHGNVQNVLKNMRIPGKIGALNINLPQIQGQLQGHLQGQLENLKNNICHQDVAESPQAAGGR